ncbi:hypothetical protein MJO28_006047 [Puccinia striiformis f. sp. tritici]|uniref:Uncharacterized protein n=1 Tax=Puccinia striiformis f. sp. tritici TaxID=168172 RepID=A0ACC0EGC0_9BASI|nr:hypothetical protein MJO28_006047 [Puccinia striiformis f. sp. tritici]
MASFVYINASDSPSTPPTSPKMQLLNLFQRPHMTLLVVAIVITVHLALATPPPPKEEKATCDEHFYPTKDPHTYMCRSNHMSYKCPIDSCKVDDKAWSQATFKNCDVLNKQKQIIHGRTLPVVVPIQYQVYPGYTDVQDRKTRWWVRCTTAQDKSNDHKSICDKCLKV